jgi:hypothetical protein
MHVMGHDEKSEPRPIAVETRKQQISRAKLQDRAQQMHTHVAESGPGEARTRRDEASRRGGRACTCRDSIPNAMYRVW